MSSENQWVIVWYLQYSNLTGHLGISVREGRFSALFFHRLTKGSFGRTVGSSSDRPRRGGGFSPPPFGFLCLSCPLRNHETSHVLSLPLRLLRVRQCANSSRVSRFIWLWPCTTWNHVAPVLKHSTAFYELGKRSAMRPVVGERRH
jgi:hypothetical protein